MLAHLKRSSLCFGTCIKIKYNKIQIQICLKIEIQIYMQIRIQMLCTWEVALYGSDIQLCHTSWILSNRGGWQGGVFTERVQIWVACAVHPSFDSGYYGASQTRPQRWIIFVAKNMFEQLMKWVVCGWNGAAESMAEPFRLPILLYFIFLNFLFCVLYFNFLKKNSVS